MKKFLTISTAAIVGLFVLYLAAGRDVLDLTGYMQASADKTVDELEGRLPQDVHDRKLTQDLARARQELIDRKVQLTQSKNQISQMQQDVTALKESLGRRTRLMAEAYPILEQAVKDSVDKVTFASAEFSLEEFQQEVDELLAAQQQEQERLEMKQSGLVRLEKSEREAEQALAEMQQALETSAQEVDVLKSRREQAEIESQTIEMVHATGAIGESESAVGRSLDRLRKEVAQIEAENQARREAAPVSERASSSKLTRQWSRMEALKAIHEQVAEDATGKESPTADQPTIEDNAPETTDDAT